MPSFLEKTINSEHIQNVLNHIYSLTPEQMRIISIIAAVLIAVMVWRKLGFRIMVVLLVIYLIVYIFYTRDIFGSYLNKEEKDNSYMDLIQREIDKSEVQKTSPAVISTSTRESVGTSTTQKK
jgi:hypothetical protein